MIAIGYLIQATLGTTTIVDGLACTPVPSSLQVSVGPGSIVNLSVIESIAYGSLPSDTNDPLAKMGINIKPTVFTLAAPQVAGQSQNYLIEASFSESDGGATVLPYYNSSNPAQPYSGPSNTGVAQNTVRQQLVALQLKAGGAATAGTQTTPPVDSGWVGLYVITVNYGQSTISASNIVSYPTAPFLPVKLPQLRRKLLANLNLYVNGSGGNDLNNGLSPITAFASLQGAWNNIISSIDLNGFQVTVNVANGTYAGVACIGTPVGATSGINNVPGQPGPPVSFVGNISTPSAVVVSAVNGNCFQAANGAAITAQGFTLQATGTAANFNQQGVGLYAIFGGGIIFGSIVFGACSQAHMISAVSSIVESHGNPYTISGSAPIHLNCFDVSYVTTSDSVVTLVGTPSFSAAFASVSNCGVIFASGMTFNGSATGQKYSASANGSIITNGAGASYFPGSTAGAVISGGQYT